MLEKPIADRLNYVLKRNYCFTNSHSFNNWKDPTRLMEEVEDMVKPEPDISLPWCLPFR